MASQGDQPRAESGIELTTLVISALASAAAAYITSKIWAPGTLFSAAMSPVIVALVKEGLRKPTQVVAQAVPTVVPTPARWSRTSASDPGLVVDPGATPPEQAAHVDPDAPHVVLPPVVAADPGPVRIYSTRARRLRWRLAVITGLLGFGICVVLYTLPELITGKSIGRSGGEATTLWGGHSKKSTTKTPTTTTSTSTSTDTTPTTTDDTKTVTETQTVTTPTETTTTPSTAAPSTAQQTPSATAPPSTTVP
jgi:hypothetical protein